MPASRAVLDDLRTRIARLESGRERRRAILPLGVEAVDRHLPDGGLRRGALHEIIGGVADLHHAAAPALFAAHLLGRHRRPVLWVLPTRDLFAPGLAAAGLHPDHLIYAETGEEADVLPVAEEGLRHGALVGVVIETARLTLQASRRLQLAAESSGVTALVIRRWRGRREPDLSGTVSATRWRLTAVASAMSPGTTELGNPRWRVELLRCRGGMPAAWTLEFREEETRFELVEDAAASAPSRNAAREEHRLSAPPRLQLG